LAWGFYAWIALLSLLILLGLYAFYRQTTEGHYLTGSTDLAPWGLYVVGVVFFVGASAGATVIGLMVHGFGREDYAPLATRAIVLALVSLIAAVAFIAVDVGSIPRMLRIPFIWQNPTSLFMYSSITYYLFGFLLLCELYYTLKINRGVATQRDRTVAKWLALAAVTFGLVTLQATDGALFAVVKARELWNTSLLPAHFTLLALVSGAAIMICIAVLSGAIYRRRIVGPQTLAHMGSLLAFFIAGAAFLEFFDFLVYTYSDVAASDGALHFLTTTHLPLTIIHVAGLVLAFAILVFRRGRATPWLTIAAVLTIIAGVAYRYNLVSVGMGISLYPFLDHEHYSPTVIEILTSVGIVALVSLAYAVITRVLPLEEKTATAHRESSS